MESGIRHSWETRARGGERTRDAAAAIRATMETTQTDTSAGCKSSIPTTAGLSFDSRLKTWVKTLFEERFGLGVLVMLLVFAKPARGPDPTIEVPVVLLGHLWRAQGFGYRSNVPDHVCLWCWGDWTLGR